MTTATNPVFRRSRSRSDRPGSRGLGYAERRHRHPAMAGLTVAPIRGWHCICERCAAQARKNR